MLMLMARARSLGGVGLSGVKSSWPTRSPRRTRRCGWGVRKSCLRASGVLADAPAGDASGAASDCARTRRAARADGRSDTGAAEAGAEPPAGLPTAIRGATGRPFRDPLCSAELCGAEPAEDAEPDDTIQDAGGAVGGRRGVPDG